MNPITSVSIKSVALGASFASGLAFMLLFFYFNDPDQAKSAAIVSWFIVLIPAAFVLCRSSNKTYLLTAVTMLSGIFLGTCVAIIVYYPDKASLFPIAAAIWTVMASIPVALGSVLGALAARRATGR